jgi:hypothetical protein
LFKVKGCIFAQFRLGYSSIWKRVRLFRLAAGAFDCLRLWSLRGVGGETRRFYILICLILFWRFPVLFRGNFLFGLLIILQRRPSSDFYWPIDVGGKSDLKIKPDNEFNENQNWLIWASDKRRHIKRECKK